MARTGVTYYDIDKAAETIKAKGLEPTVDRIREQLGTGSKSTIAPLLRRWRSVQTEPNNTDGIPEEIIEVVEMLHTRLQKSADGKIEAAQENFEIAQRNYTKQISELEACIDRLETEQKSAERYCQELKLELSSTHKTLNETRTHLAKTESKYDDVLERLNESKDNIIELKAENRDIREHLEHYQQSVAEDRERERTLHRSTLDMNQERIHRLEENLAQSELENQNLQSSLINQNSLCSELKELHSENQVRLQVSKKANQQLQEEFTDLKQQYNQLMADNKKYTNEVINANKAQATSDKDLVMLNHQLRSLQKDLSMTQSTLQQLTTENKQLLQEKAILQGQFNQLKEFLS